MHDRKENHEQKSLQAIVLKVCHHFKNHFRFLSNFFAWVGNISSIPLKKESCYHIQGLLKLVSLRKENSCNIQRYLKLISLRKKNCFVIYKDQKQPLKRFPEDPMPSNYIAHAHAIILGRQ